MSQLQVNRINDASGGVLAPISSVMRNRFINGQMVIAQRGTTFSGLSDDGGQYTLDRWRWSENGTYTGSQTVTQDSSAPAGFTNSLRVVTNTAITTGTSLSSRVEQAIEGFNFADCGWGTANAKTVTLSFWVKSSLTGTFGGAFRNSADDRSYPFSYTISVADTWEQKSVTVAGDTSGTWVGATNGVGVRINFSLGAGTALSGTAGAWAAGGFQSVTGAVAVNATTSANWAVTGCQLEVGTQATSFEYRQYTTELQLCQRYYWKTDSSAGAWNYIGSGVVYSSTLGFAYTQYPVLMRSAPTISTYGTVNSTNVQLIAGGVATGVTAIAGAGATETNPMSTRIDFTTSGATGGQGCLPRLANGVGVTFSAEL